MSNHKRGGISWVKHDKILTAKQAEFVNKELSTGHGIMSVKENCNSQILVRRDRASTMLYQKALITGIENKVKHNNKKKSPAQMKECSILSDHVKYITSDR